MAREVLKLAGKRIARYLIIMLLVIALECGYFFGLRTILIYFGVDSINAGLISIFSLVLLCMLLGFCAYQVDQAKEDLNR